MFDMDSDRTPDPESGEWTKTLAAGLARAMQVAVAATMPSCQVRCTFDETTLARTPLGVVDAQFRADAQAIAARACRLTRSGRHPTRLVMHFSGVPLTGTVRCRMLADGLCAHHKQIHALAEYAREHGAAVEHAGPGEVTLAMYPPEISGS